MGPARRFANRNVAGSSSPPGDAPEVRTGQWGLLVLADICKVECAAPAPDQASGWEEIMSKKLADGDFALTPRPISPPIRHRPPTPHCSRDNAKPCAEPAWERGETR